MTSWTELEELREQVLLARRDGDEVTLLTIRWAVTVKLPGGI
jgi:hypothetical protein